MIMFIRCNNDDPLYRWKSIQEGGTLNEAADGKRL